MEEMNIVISLQGEYYMVEHAGSYFKLGLQEGRILEKLSKKEETAHILEEEKLTEEQLNQYIEAFRNAGIIGKPRKRKNHILFFRIPLFQADAMFTNIVACINKHKKIAKYLLMLSIVISLVGCILMGIRFADIYSSSLLHLDLWEYITIYVVFLLTVCMHEMGHGIACKYNGGKVGTLGLMLILFSPAMYCDISGVRMMHDKKKQIMASAAGIYVNLFFTGLTSILYVIKPYPLFAAFIVLNVTTIISNSIPVVRLDGYWMLSFATGITNLYKRSLRSVGNLFRKCSKTDKFIAVYGVITYAFLTVALSSAAYSLFQLLKWIANFVSNNFH